MGEHFQMERLPHRQWVIGFAIYALVGGVLTLTGWFAEQPWLTDWLGSGIAMFPNTAVAVICCSLALLLQVSQRRWATMLSPFFGLCTALIGGAALFEHLSRMDLRIDTLLVDVKWGNQGSVAPGRMGLPACTSFILLGLAQILASWRWQVRRICPVLTLGVSVIAMLSISGYWFGTHALFAAQYSTIALQTATMLLALGLALLVHLQEHEPARTLFEDSAAGLLARRSLPFVIALPLGLGWLLVRGHNAGLYDAPMGTVLLVLALISIFCPLLWWSTRAVRRREQALRDSREQLRQAQQQLSLHASRLEATVAERTAKLQESVNELQTLSYSIAHDMRAPLRAMGTFSQLLAEEVSNLSPIAMDYCRRIMTGAERMDHLIQDALHYTKTALQDIQLQPVNLTTFIPDLIQTYPNLQKENADISIASPLPVILGNDALLTQCFANLLGNAVKFVAAGTRPRIRIWAETNNGRARIWIEDNGVGIASGSQEQIFGMFHKLDLATEGTGIGLAIVRKVVERMHGKVGVESEPNRGSRFWVELKVPAEQHE